MRTTSTLIALIASIFALLGAHSTANAAIACKPDRYCPGVDPAPGPVPLPPGTRR